MQLDTDCLGVLTTSLGQGNVGVPGVLPIPAPFRLSMPDKYDFRWTLRHRRHRMPRATQPLAFGAVPLDRLAAAGDPQLRRILLYARGRREGFVADEAAAALGIHRNVARSRLDRLAEAGFLAVSLERRGGRRGPGAGRPAKVYNVAPELEAVEFPDRRLADLIGLLVGKLPARGKEKALREAGMDFGRSLAAAARLKTSGDLRAGLERVCAGLGSLGFQASLQSLAGDRAILASATCPLRPLVVKHPDASEIDRGMWTGLVERGVRGMRAERVQCETPSCLSEDEPCTILLSLGLQEAKPSGSAAS
jgi:predicted ArsR family transcriptional regulator